jgi:hypothetical protein
VYDKDLKKSYSSKVNSIACEGYFYDDERLDKEKDKVQYLENLYSEIETNFAPYYIGFLESLNKSDSFEISPNDRSAIANYLVTQIDRTKEHREEAYQFTIEIYNQLKEKGFSQKQLKQMGFENGNFDKKELHLESIITGNEMRDTLSEILNEHIWIIFKNDSSHSFYTSDHPLVKYGHIKDEMKSNEGYGSPGIEIAFPINPRYMLVMLDREYFNKFNLQENKVTKITSADHVKYFNFLQVVSCYRQVFSESDNFKIIEEIQEKFPAAFDLNRKRTG